MSMRGPSERAAGAVGAYVGTGAPGQSGWGWPLSASRLREPAIYFVVSVALVAMMDARRTLLGRGASQLLDFDNIDFLTLFEWSWIVALALRTDFSTFRVGLVERGIGLAFGCYALFFVAPNSHILTMVMGLGLAARLSLARACRPLAISLALASLQLLPGTSVLNWLNELTIPIDALGAHLLLLAGGYPNTLNGAVVALNGSTHAIVINDPCGTLPALWHVECAFGIFALCAGARLDNSFPGQGLRLAGCVYALNWLRLCGMTLSPDYYQFLHSGAGASVLSTLYAVMAYGMAEHLATRSRAGQSVARLSAL